MTVLNRLRATYANDDFRPKVKTYLYSRPVRNTLIALLIFALVAFAYQGPGVLPNTPLAPPSPQSETGAGVVSGALNGTQKWPGQARFHFLVPATSSNADLCKLLLSAQILDYPTPVLINVGHPEAENPYVSHLAKVQGLLDYLDDVKENDGTEEDLVLIVDGYDVWFQLHRDVLLRRYYAANEAADDRTREMFGGALFDEHDMRQTIIFGPDKICWPIDLSRPACWAIPETSLPPLAFGPRTDEGREEFNGPRWLNSGTVMGPAKDIRDLLRAAEAEIHANYVTDSDQFYLAELFGGQSYARLERKPELIPYFKNIRYGQERSFKEEDLYRREPNLTSERREFHIGIDYESSLFQTLAFYKFHLTWTRAADAWEIPPDDPAEDQYSINVTEDVLASSPPFVALRTWKAPHNVTVNSTWEEVELLHNTATNQTPAVVHLAGGPDEKRHRELWWQKLWFQAYSEKLRLASVEASALRLASEESKGPEEVIGGYRWRNAEPPEAQDVPKHGLGGAFADIAGGWFSWRGLCKAHEKEIFRVSGDDVFHPPPVAPD